MREEKDVIIWGGENLDEKKLMQMFSSMLDEKLQPINKRFETLEGGQKTILTKLDNISKQVAANTEMQTSVEDIAVKVSDHDKDIKFLKKFITN